jgi:hypothetical protein
MQFDWRVRALRLPEVLNLLFVNPFKKQKLKWDEGQTHNLQ